MNRIESKQYAPHPIAKAGFLSKLTFWWLRNLFREGMKRPLEEEDLYQNLHCFDSDRLTTKLEKLWEYEKKQKSPNLIKVMLRAYGFPVISWGLIFSILDVIQRVLQPLMLGGMVSYFVPGQTEHSVNDAYFYATGIVLTSLIPVITFHPFILYIFCMGLRLRVGISGLLYKKALCLSKSSAIDGLSGRLINLLASDVGKFDIAMAFIHDLWRGPIEAAILGYCIYREIGISAVIGMAFLLSFIPLQIWVGKMAAHYRLKTAKTTDFRVKIMNEIIHGIQVIKMYTWEKSFAGMVSKIRKKEMNGIRGTLYIRAALISFEMISKVALFISIVSYIYFGNLITASKVFIVTSYFNMLNASMVFFWPMAITCVQEARISAARCTEFLLESEDKPRAVTTTPVQNGDSRLMVKIERNGQATVNGDANTVTEQTSLVNEAKKRVYTPSASQCQVIMRNVTAMWEVKDDESATGVFAMTMELRSPTLCAVIGQVGMGKSSLLNVIIGELAVDEGDCIIDGKISYCSQEPWLFEGSVRRNIVFIEEYDERRYNHVVKICALETDFKQFPKGDATIVGEKGISLSGGQKARVNLARAVYKKADIYLLDDPLSAVDTKVGKHIFEKVVKEFLKDKICILVTHQLQYLSDIEHVYLLNGGKLEAKGSFKELKEIQNKSFLALHAPDEHEGSEMEKIDKEFQKITAPATKNVDEADFEEDKEAQAAGTVKFDVYKVFFKSAENAFIVIFVITLFVVSQSLISAVDYFLSRWVNWEESVASAKETTLSKLLLNETLGNINGTVESMALNATATAMDIDPVENEERLQYITTYAILMAVSLYCYLHRTFAFFKMCLQVSINLHDKLFSGVTRATMRFFNTNPSGRILNRFSKDIHSIDISIPPVLADVFRFFLEIGATIAIVALVNYWLLIPTIVVGVIFYLIRIIYINTGRSIKRIESITRSPVFSHTNATLQGLSTIRAMGAEEMLIKEFHNHQNLNSVAWHIYITTTRAFGLWLDIVCCLFIAVVTYSFLVFDMSTTGGSAGLAILYCINLSFGFQWGMRQTADLENQMTSVERVLEYAQLPSEPALKSAPKHRPPIGWPESGAITVKDLSLKYSEDGEQVLRDLSFRIEPKEKIGVVGRTGAGKSSIIQALFRLAVNEGSVHIDGINTNTLGLHDLRSQLSIIPQDPVLFSGTLRLNLDPFETNTDAELWSALADVELKPVVAAMAGGLDCKMSDTGSNFSMGQRQLVCLARAILRNNKILIMDEATANVDPETDRLIQETIRTKFCNCTVITIAHRLHTVMDSDRVLVIDGGKVVEFGHTYELLQIPGGFLKRLVSQTGPATAALLTQAALESYQLKKEKRENSEKHNQLPEADS